MLLDYLNYYLIYLIVLSVLGGLFVWLFGLKSPKVFISLLLALIFLPAMAVYFYSAYFAAMPEVMVPDLKGLSLEQASSHLERFQLKARHSGMVFNMDYAEGMIVSQRPEAGRMVKGGRTVYLITSSGRRRVVVPNLLGRPAEQAEAVLKANGLRLGQLVEEPVPDIDPGLILTQSPLPGEEVDGDAYVNLTVSASGEFETAEPARLDRGKLRPQRPAPSAEALETQEEQKKEEGWWFWPW